MSIDPDSASPPRCGWAVYYDDRRITVTSWYVDTPGGRYPTANLGGVLQVLTYAHPGRTVALIAGGIEVGLALPFTVAYQSAAMFLVGLFAAAGLGAGILVDARRNPRRLELRAAHRGTEVVLFTSRDLAEFERVRWALIRALEITRSPLP
jgi:hypothetical protein